jgi:hypothetical protein
VAISAKPNRQKSDVEQTSADVDEREVQAIINRGGRAAEANNGESDPLRRVQLRLYTSQIADIDNAIEKLKQDRKRFPNFSRHQFLLEAIEEKLDREL